jgi:hypothetical protein
MMVAEGGAWRAGPMDGVEDYVIDDRAEPWAMRCCGLKCLSSIVRISHPPGARCSKELVMVSWCAK